MDLAIIIKLCINKAGGGRWKNAHFEAKSHKVSITSKAHYIT